MAQADAFLIICRIFRVITGLTALLCVAVNVLSTIRYFQNQFDIFNGIFRCFAVLISCFAVVAETEWDTILKFWLVLEYWTGRGLLQIFVAVMTRAFSDTNGEAEWLVLLQNTASYVLMGCGVIYFILGILCIGRLEQSRQSRQQSRQQKQISKVQAAKDLEELDQRRKELHGLLLEQPEGV